MLLAVVQTCPFFLCRYTAGFKCPGLFLLVSIPGVVIPDGLMSDVGVEAVTPNFWPRKQGMVCGYIIVNWYQLVNGPGNPMALGMMVQSAPQ